MMASVRFILDFDYKPVRAVTVEYKAGWEGTVKKDCAMKAVAAGKAVWIGGRTRPAKKAVSDGGDQISG
ncbi:hypothetical protein V6R98_27290 [Agrobacterium sp. CCNWLW71]|uniref:hypothetical protein n=1 Tax=unclassified Agrobacterium TaxID=2632611 RepID=UPI002FF1BE78